MAGQTQAMMAGKPGTPTAGCCVSRGDPGLCACESACYGWVIAQAIVGAVDAITAITMGAAGLCVPAVIAGAWQTGKVREKRGEGPRSCGTCTCDFIRGYFCGCCINIKNYRDTKAMRQTKPPVQQASKVLSPVIVQPRPQPHTKAMRQTKPPVQQESEVLSPVIVQPRPPPHAGGLSAPQGREDLMY